MKKPANKEKKGFVRRNLGPFIGATVVVVLCILTIIVDSTHNNASENTVAVPPPTVTTPTIPTVPTPTTPTTTPSRPSTKPIKHPPSTHPVVKVTPEIMAAANAARDAGRELSLVQFATAAQMRPTVNKYMAPRSRQAYLKYAPIGAQIVAKKELGYASSYAAALAAGYLVVPQAWKVKAFSRGKATIAIYELALATDATEQPFANPEILLYDMEKINGKWLEVGTRQVPSNEEPRITGHLKTAEVERRYGPFLGGFRPYGP